MNVAVRRYWSHNPLIFRLAVLLVLVAAPGVSADTPGPAGGVGMEATGELVVRRSLGTTEAGIGRSRSDETGALTRSFLNTERIVIALSDGDESYFRDASRVVHVCVKADIEREWVRGLLLDTLAIYNQLSYPALALAPEPMSMRRMTQAEVERRDERARHGKLLLPLITGIIDSFGAVRDCRLASDLVSVIGYWAAIDRRALGYMNAACLGDRTLADEVHQAVLAIPWQEHYLFMRMAALALISAAAHPVGYTSPSDRIRRLWHAPLVEHDRVDRGLVADEVHHLSAVLRNPKAHVTAMRELVSDMKWGASGSPDTEELQWLKVRGMVAILAKMPLVETRQLLGEWFMVFDQDVPDGHSASHLRWDVLDAIGSDCVPQLATWMVAQLARMEEREMQRSTGLDGDRVRNATWAIQRQLSYLAACQSEMPEIRSEVSRAAAGRPGTLLSREFERVFGPTTPDSSQPDAHPRE